MESVETGEAREAVAAAIDGGVASTTLTPPTPTAAGTMSDTAVNIYGHGDHAFFLSPEMYWTTRYRVAEQCKLGGGPATDGAAGSAHDAGQATLPPATPLPPPPPPPQSAPPRQSVPGGNRSLVGEHPRSLLSTVDHARWLYLLEHDTATLNRSNTPQSLADPDDQRQAEVRSLMSRYTLEQDTFAAHHRQHTLADPARYAQLLSPAREMLEVAFREANATTLRDLPRYYVYRGIGLQPGADFADPSDSGVRVVPSPRTCPPHENACSASAVRVVAGAVLAALKAPSAQHHPENVVTLLNPTVDGVAQTVGASVVSRRERLGAGPHPSLDVNLSKIRQRLQTTWRSNCDSAFDQAVAVETQAHPDASASWISCDSNVLTRLFALIAVGGGATTELRLPFAVREQDGPSGRVLHLFEPVLPQANLREWNHTYIEALMPEIFGGGAVVDEMVGATNESDGEAAVHTKLWRCGPDGPTVVLHDLSGAMSVDGEEGLVVPGIKVEYQPQAGPEEWLVHELATLWARAYFCGGAASAIVARVDIESLAVVRVEQMTLAELASGFDPEPTLRLLTNLLCTMAEVRDVGSYLLLQRPGEDSLKLTLWRETDGGCKGAHDLHSGLDAGVPSDTPPASLYVPISEPWVRPDRQLPRTFPPADKARASAGVCFMYHDTGKCGNPTCQFAHYTAAEAAAVEPEVKVPPLQKKKQKKKNKKKNPTKRSATGELVPTTANRVKRTRRASKKRGGKETGQPSRDTPLTKPAAFTSVSGAAADPS